VCECVCVSVCAFVSVFCVFVCVCVLYVFVCVRGKISLVMLKCDRTKQFALATGCV
jgi:hypothetical protein